MLESKQRLVSSIVFEKYKEQALKSSSESGRFLTHVVKAGTTLILQMFGKSSNFSFRMSTAFFFDAYELTIRQICLSVAQTLPANEMRLLWLWSAEYVEWDEEGGADPPYSVDGVAEQIYTTVCEVGIDEPLSRDDEIEDGEDDGDDDQESEAQEVTIPIQISVELTPEWRGERWDVVDVIDQRNGESIGEIGVSHFDAYSDFPGHLLMAVMKTLRGEGAFEQGVFHSVIVDIIDGGSSIGKATAHFWNDGLPAWK